MNSEIDEIGSNLLGSSDILNTFLELYDVGKIKQKLVKNTAESLRSEEIVGRTPCNLLMFGTPSKLLDGGKTEEDYFSFFVRAVEGCSPHVTAGQLLEIVGVDVVSIDGQEFDPDPEDPGPGPEDM